MTQPSDIAPTTIGAAAPRHRVRQLAYAMGAGLTSKVLATFTQLAALPIALHALGTERYAAFLTLQALIAWTGLLGFGVVPSLPGFLSRAYVGNDRQEQRNLFISSAAFIGVTGLALLCLMFAVTAIVSPVALVAAKGITTAEIGTAYYVIAAMQCGQLVLSLMPAVRSGYQELHYSYIWSSIANLFVIALIFAIADGAPTISVFFAALYGPIMGAMLLDAGLILWQRPFLACGRVEFARTVRKLAPHASNVLAMQASYFMLAWFPLVIVAHLAGPAATAGFGSLMQLLVLANSGLNLLFQPLVPAIANAYAHRDSAWIRRAYARTAATIGAVCAIALAAAIAGGPAIVHLWLGRDLDISRTMTGLLALYFGIWTSSFFHFNILAAMGELVGAGKIYVLEATLSLAIGATLTYFYGADGMAGGMALAVLCASGWYMPWRTFRVLRRMRET